MSVFEAQAKKFARRKEREKQILEDPSILEREADEKDRKKKLNKRKKAWNYDRKLEQGVCASPQGMPNKKRRWEPREGWDCYLEE